MMRYARYDDPCYPCHVRNVAGIFRKCQELSILSPELPEMNYPAASYGVSKAPIRNRLFAASCGELTRMRLKNAAI
jgi:hypothetical protein